MAFVEEVSGDMIRLIYDIVDDSYRLGMSKEMLKVLPGHGLKRQ